MIKDLRNKIINFANADEEFGWLKVICNDKCFRFPKRALILYVFGESPPLRERLPEYIPFSPPGLKLQLDNQYHSDVLIGAGFSLKNAYVHSHLEKEALALAVDAIENEMKELVDFDFTILANGLPENVSRFQFRVYEHSPPLKPGHWSSNHIDSIEEETPNYEVYTPKLRAICIPHAGVEYDLPARKADLIITEAGGKLSHLAILSRESNRMLIRVDNACQIFPPFTKMEINIQSLKLSADY